MTRLLFLAATAFVVCCRLGAADRAAPPPEAPAAAAGDYHDVVYFAESGPILLRLRVTVDGRPLAAVWDDYVAKVFRHLDANGDGFLGRVEAQRMPPPSVLFGSGSGPNGAPAPAFLDLDADGDGKVTRTELAAYFRRSGYGPFQVPGGNGPGGVHSLILKAPGGNGPGGARSIVLNERNFDVTELGFFLDGAIDIGSGGRNADNLNDALFKLLDTNGDGKLSKAELLAAATVLLKRDRNDDELITPDEITTTNHGAANMGSDATVTYAYFLDPSHGNNGLFRLVSPLESSLEMARVLQERYAAKDRKTVGMGLTRADLGVDSATFALLDVDGNGRLDLEELSRFARRPPDLELKLDLGKKTAVELVKRGTPIERNVRAGRDGALVLELGATRIDLKGLAAPQAQTAAVSQQLRQQYVAEFKAADRDNNGYLDMTEAMRSPFFRNTFKTMDRDGDGKLFEKEMLAFLDDFLDLQAAARASCVSVGMTTEGKGLFELLDTDGDGRLSVREMHNAVKLIAEFDRDGDGQISRAEIPRCSQAAFRLGPAAPTDAIWIDSSALAFSPDGRLFGGQRRPAKPARGPEWFRKMDRNGDGDVSRREFLGTDEQFRAMDTDGDGLISVEEAETYDKKTRAVRDKSLPGAK